MQFILERQGSTIHKCAPKHTCFYYSLCIVIFICLSLSLTLSSSLSLLLFISLHTLSLSFLSLTHTPLSFTHSFTHSLIHSLTHSPPSAHHFIPPLFSTTNHNLIKRRDTKTITPLLLPRVFFISYLFFFPAHLFLSFVFCLLHTTLRFHFSIPTH
ncbi:hypothetical protein F5H01DRAFT_336527 [Linnemannia elongata]|nr:hypothetical protein F5H01DRAFT_336527 [Linnemannia elongata]